MKKAIVLFIVALFSSICILTLYAIGALYHYLIGVSFCGENHCKNLLATIIDGGSVFITV